MKRSWTARAGLWGGQGSRAPKHSSCSKGGPQQDQPQTCQHPPPPANSKLQILPWKGAIQSSSFPSDSALPPRRMGTCQEDKWLISLPWVGWGQQGSSCVGCRSHPGTAFTAQQAGSRRRADARESRQVAEVPGSQARVMPFKPGQGLLPQTFCLLPLPPNYFFSRWLSCMKSPLPASQTLCM